MHEIFKKNNMMALGTYKVNSSMFPLMIRHAVKTNSIIRAPWTYKLQQTITETCDHNGINIDQLNIATLYRWKLPNEGPLPKTDEEIVNYFLNQYTDDINRYHLQKFYEGGLHGPLPVNENGRHQKHVLAMRVFEQLKQEGKISRIGVANFSLDDLQKLNEEIPLDFIVTEAGRWWWPHDLITYAQENNIDIYAYFTFGGSKNKGNDDLFKAPFLIEAANRLGIPHEKIPHMIWDAMRLKGVTPIMATNNPDRFELNCEVLRLDPQIPKEILDNLVQNFAKTHVKHCKFNQHDYLVNDE